ncbi:type II secretion system F family protein [Corynebacterium alimapuense]|uniref:Type II secretion protein F n=1 Tax=Corynebacterium alimapuense TaxID=1576874 RepID=A0A3M8K978_9CORY|nr:type II secretion system F family protein [Corynebacterium alimapuense]RNE49008.1 type II secretion protein F [Corynebacterium alimapuense]
MSLLLIALALLIPAGRVAQRLNIRGPKTPRDGPRPHAPRLDRLAVAADIDLFAACIRAGLADAEATVALASVGTDEATRKHWDTVAALLRIGVPADRAWAEVEGLPGLGELAGLAKISQQSGSAMAQASERIARGLRAEAIDEATAQGERAGVLIALPLAACFLPAFFVLGLAPVVISLGSTLLTG